MDQHQASGSFLRSGSIDLDMLNMNNSTTVGRPDPVTNIINAITAEAAGNPPISSIPGLGASLPASFQPFSMPATTIQAHQQYRYPTPFNTSPYGPVSLPPNPSFLPPFDPLTQLVPPIGHSPSSRLSPPPPPHSSALSSPVEWPPPPDSESRNMASTNQSAVTNSAAPINPVAFETPPIPAANTVRVNDQRKRGGTTSSRGRGTGNATRGAKGSRKGGLAARATTSIEGQRSHPSSPCAEDDTEKKSAKRGRARGMNAEKKLILIRECCEHAAEFKLNNKTAFWIMIRDLLKQRTGYLLKEPRNTVLRWVADRRDELVEEEMGSSTQVDQDDFKAAVEQFADRLKVVDDELANQVKTQKAKAAELFQSARLQSALVFGLDDEPILGIDASSSLSGVSRSGGSNALNSLARLAVNKRKREASSRGGPSSDAMLLADSFRDSAAVLAKALTRTKVHVETAPTPAPPPILATVPVVEEQESARALQQKIATIDARLTEVQGNMEARMGDVTSLLGKILAAVGASNTADKTTAL